MKELLIFGMLFTGTINTLSKKWQNEQVSKGIDGKMEPFRFPWTQTLIMYCGETLCMIGFLVSVYLARRRAQRAAQQEMSSTESAMLIKKDEPAVAPIKFTKLTPFLFLMVSILDLAGTTLAGIGLLYTYASVYQMLRGSIIVFGGLLRVTVLKSKLLPNQWVGILITVCGLVIVGWSAMMDESGTFPADQLLFGNGLIIAGQFANAVQFVVEEVFLKKHNYPPLLVVGAEGSWGIVLMVSIVLPVLYYVPGPGGHYENALDAAVQIGNNHILLTLVLAYWLSIAFYNFCGLSVAKRLTSVHRTFIDALRTICVWTVQIILYYTLHDPKIGEPWGKHSLIQLGGFVLLMCGTVVYNNVHKTSYEYWKARRAQQNVNSINKS